MTNATATAHSPIAAAVIAMIAGVGLSVVAAAAMLLSPAVPIWCSTHGCPSPMTIPATCSLHGGCP